MIGSKKDILDYLSKQDDEMLFKCEKAYVKKTFSQNNYAWELMRQIANVMRISIDEVYNIMLQRYGQFTTVSLLNTIENVDSYFDHYKLIGSGSINDKQFNHYRVYKGISKYDIKEMGIFIDGVVWEANKLNLKTMTKREIENMRL